MELSDEELTIVLKLIRAKLPAILSALDEGGNGWRQILTLSCYLMAATLNRHPEYAENVAQLMPALGAFYAQADADFAASSSALWRSLVEDDVATILIPETFAVKQPN
jgi:hypothetical protein